MFAWPSVILPYPLLLARVKQQATKQNGEHILHALARAEFSSHLDKTFWDGLRVDSIGWVKCNLARQCFARASEINGLDSWPGKSVPRRWAPPTERDFLSLSLCQILRQSVKFHGNS